ncbi:LuxR C-terminal-related transcriptional regulator [Paenibacillus whitsoniae]|uniref:HTH luxR-type domain-containing protein n=1 Tax=Paenibacillus whitsoniae TaxID=2496558 RepID=A0A3R9ZZP0_9BACL|nr:LuxR C-terminal-related transcriptional regulator [Paenibacillus whitsoniae]RTE02443.1 hypothetical protein EJQ19_29445 [Paenibacillus whitsoniae]
MTYPPEQANGQFQMNDYPLVSTKLYIPHKPSAYVAREKLNALLDKTPHCKLTLVISPPGFGKTTLVSQWCLNQTMPVGWVSLDRGENDWHRFWTYLISAIQRLYPGVGHKSLSLLQTMSCSPEQMISWLLNDLFELGHDLVLVLDDYYVIENEDIHRSIAFLFERMPPSVHLVMLSRKQPPLSTGLLRVSGQLNEISSADLRFTNQEMTLFWERRTGKGIQDAALKTLSERTEGWIAGIQLAVLSHLAGQPDALRRFKGDHRYVVDYLMQEVFVHLPEDTRHFLTTTAILERLHPRLCAALTGKAEDASKLQELERLSLFVIPLDADGIWYRYHPLFSDFLRSRWAKEDQTDLASLHDIASRWLEQHHYTNEAIEHALAAKDYERAGELIAASATNLLKRRELATLHRWLMELPDPIRERPELLITLVWTELIMGRSENLEGYVRLLQKILDVPGRHKSSLHIAIGEDVKVAKTYHAMLKGDFERCIALLQAMLDDESLPDIEGLPMLFGLGIELNDGAVPLIRGYYGFNGSIKKSESYHRLYATFIEKQSFHDFPFTAYQRTAMSEVCLERNRLTEALQFAEDAIRIASLNRIVGAYLPAEIVRVQIAMARGDTKHAMNLLEGATEQLELMQQRQSQWEALLQACKVRCLLSLGELNAAQEWCSAMPWSRQQDMMGNREYELLTYIRVQMCTGNWKEAQYWCEQLLSQARSASRTMTEIETLLCLAQIYENQEQAHFALLHLHEALLLGEREGCLQCFSETNYRKLLRQYAEMRQNNAMTKALTAGVSRSFLQHILSLHIGQEPKDSTKESEAHSVFMLTAREEEVLQLLAEGLSNKSIASRLVLTEGTVKLHLHRIYSKLQVANRIQAIQEAKQKGLLK